MRQFSAQEIQEKFEKLPLGIQAALTSPDLNKTIRAIGETHNLHIDQIGELVDIIGLIMLGLSPAADFVKNFSQAASIDEKAAREIAMDINREVFSKIKDSMQVVEQQAGQENVSEDTRRGISSLEATGDFSIEHEQDQKNSSYSEVTAADQAAILAGIEDPEPSEAHVDPIIDHLLSKPAAIPEQKIVQKSPEPQQTGAAPQDSKPAAAPEPLAQPSPAAAPRPPAPPAPPTPPARQGPDPYREPIQ